MWHHFKICSLVLSFSVRCSKTFNTDIGSVLSDTQKKYLDTDTDTCSKMYLDTDTDTGFQKVSPILFRYIFDTFRADFFLFSGEILVWVRGKVTIHDEFDDQLKDKNIG